jgi:hypothetical protein
MKTSTVSRVKLETPDIEIREELTAHLYDLHAATGTLFSPRCGLRKISPPHRKGIEDSIVISQESAARWSGVKNLHSTLNDHGCAARFLCHTWNLRAMAKLQQFVNVVTWSRQFSRRTTGGRWSRRCRKIHLWNCSKSCSQIVSKTWQENIFTSY